VYPSKSITKLIFWGNIPHVPFTAFGKLTVHESANSTFEEARKTCQQEGGELVRDFAFLWARKEFIASTLAETKLVSVLIGKHLFPFKYGMFRTSTHFPIYVFVINTILLVI